MPPDPPRRARASLAPSPSPVTLNYSPATTFLNENPCTPYPISRGQVYEYIKSTKKFCNCLFLLRNAVLNPKCRAYTRNSFNSCGVSSLFSSVIFSERTKFGNKIIHDFSYSHRANILTRQPIRTTTRFLGSDVTGQHYCPVPSDVSLPRLSERRRWLKFRLCSAMTFTYNTLNENIY